MGTTSLSGGGHNTNVGSGNNRVYGAGNNTVSGGNGNNTVRLGKSTGGGSSQVNLGNGNNKVVNDGSSSVTVGGGNNNILTHGDGNVQAGDGNNKIIVDGNGTIAVGNGSDTIVIGGNSTVVGQLTVGNGNDSISVQHGTEVINLGTGNDTLTLGNTTDTVFENGGHATISFALSVNATVAGAGGELTFGKSPAGYYMGDVVSGSATLQAAHMATTVLETGGGTGTVDASLMGGAGSTVFIGGGGDTHDTMTGGTGHNYFEFFTPTAGSGGQHVITNFAAGDKLYVEGMSLTQLTNANDISQSGGNTVITLADGTSITLQGFTDSLSQSMITTPHHI